MTCGVLWHHHQILKIVVRTCVYVGGRCALTIWAFPRHFFISKPPKTEKVKSNDILMHIHMQSMLKLSSLLASWSLKHFQLDRSRKYSNVWSDRSSESIIYSFYSARKDSWPYIENGIYIKCSNCYAKNVSLHDWKIPICCRFWNMYEVNERE